MALEENDLKSPATENQKQEIERLLKQGDDLGDSLLDTRDQASSPAPSFLRKKVVNRVDEKHTSSCGCFSGIFKRFTSSEASSNRSSEASALFKAPSPTPY